ncbi:MAG: DUF488 family protein [Kiritimatiellia bacterium]
MTAAQESHILALIGTESDGLRPIEIQKLMFMYTRLEEDVPSYDFIPYRQGCYSPTLSQDVHRLAQKGLLKARNPCDSDHKTWMLTEEGEICVWSKRATATRFTRFRKDYPLRGKDLIADVYRKFPYWAINSEIRDIVLKDDTAAMAAIEAARPTKSVSLASIGYEGRSFENYLNALIRNGVEVLCDVRRNPISRKYGFSKSTLHNACEGLGIEYRHFPELGIPSFERTDLRYQSDYDELFARYEKTVLPRVGDTVDVLARLVEGGRHIALTCFEANPAQCHRTRVLNAIAERTGVEGELI